MSENIYVLSEPYDNIVCIPYKGYEIRFIKDCSKTIVHFNHGPTLYIIDGASLTTIELAKVFIDNQIDDVTPFAVSSIVYFENINEKYLIEEVKINPLEYSVVGHKNLGTEGEASAWHSHCDLHLISGPSTENLKLLEEAFGYEGAEED